MSFADLDLNRNLARLDAFRKFKNYLALSILWLLAVLAILPLGLVLIYVLRQGIPALNLDFFTQLPTPVGQSGGGMANALVGSMVLMALSSFMGVPIGIAAGIFLAEYQHSRLALYLRFANDILTSIPSIVIGLFAYAFVVVPMRGFSAHAGGVALAIIMIPIIARTTEEILKLVPQHIREAGLALGIPRWKVIIEIVVLRAGMAGVLTGVMLAVARIAGETAPLLFTAFNNRFWASSLSQPIASLPIQIYTYAVSPFADWQSQAWAAALVLVLFVLGLNLFVRLVFARR